MYSVRELVLIMISNAACTQKLNKRQKVVEECSAKMVAQFGIGKIFF
jgi:hypothetical protein